MGGNSTGLILQREDKYQQQVFTPINETNIYLHLESHGNNIETILISHAKANKTPVFSYLDQTANLSIGKSSQQ